MNIRSGSNEKNAGHGLPWKIIFNFFVHGHRLVPDLPVVFLEVFHPHSRMINEGGNNSCSLFEVISDQVIV